MTPKHTAGLMAIASHYSNPANAPLSYDEIGWRITQCAHGRNKNQRRQVVARVLDKYLCLCRDGMVRIRSLSVLPELTRIAKENMKTETPLSGETLPIELTRDYDGAAEWCAIRGLTGAIGDPLPANMQLDGALKYINADPEAFQERVRQFAYARAMESAAIRRSLASP